MKINFIFLIPKNIKMIVRYLDPYNIKLKDYTKLEGYLSENFKVVTSEDNTYVLKVYLDPAKKEGIYQENKILSYLAKQLDYKISYPVGNLQNKDISSFPDGSFCRLLNYIPGVFLSRENITVELVADLATKVAMMDKSLFDQSNSAIEARRIKWDMQQIGLTKKDIGAIKIPADRKIISYFIDQYEYMMRDSQLRMSIIHNDINENNILINAEHNTIEGIIDFGDMVYAPIAQEIAVALTYIMMLSEEPLIIAQTFIEYYHATYPIEKKELTALYYMVAARLCISVVSSAKAKLDQVDTAYILQTEDGAWKLLYRWLEYNPIDVENCFLRAAGYATNKAKEKADRQIELRKLHFSTAQKMTYDEPIHMQSAAFQYMYDIYGNTYLDAYNNIPLIGHNHPRITEAVDRQIRKLNTNTRYYFDSLTNYADKLLSYFPEKLSKVFFVNSGSEATDLAIRLAKNFTQRKSVVVVDQGYHGHTQTGIRISSYKYNGKGGAGMQDGVIQVPLPKLYRGDFATSQAYVSHAEKTLTQAQSEGKEIACFITEIVSGCGGQVPLAPGYLSGIYSYLKYNNIPLIADEVQTGFGRMGQSFWAYKLKDVVPEIVCLGKPMGNGHPIGAVVTTEEIADAFDNGMEFFSSFGGNPVSCEVGMAVLNTLEEEGLQENANVVGSHMQTILKELQKKYPVIGDVRGHGLFLGVELVDPEKNQSETKLAQYIKNEMRQNFVLTSSDGKEDHVLKIKPPLCFSKKNAERYCDLLDQLLGDYLL